MTFSWSPPNSSLAPEQEQFVEPVFEFLDIGCEFVHPERGALADRGQLRGLQMRVAEAGQRPVFDGERFQVAKNLRRFFQNDPGRLAKRQYVGVVPDVAGRRAEVDDGFGGRALFAERVDVRHDVVAHFLLAGFGDLVVDVVFVRFHLRDLLARHG